MASIGSPVVKRSIIRDGHKSSVSLEDQFWNALREIAGGENMTVSALVATIDRGRNRANLSSALRVFVLEHLRRSEKASIGRPFMAAAKVADEIKPGADAQVALQAVDFQPKVRGDG